MRDVLKTLFIGSSLKFIVPGGHASYGKILFLDYSKKQTLVSAIMEKFMQTWTILLFGSWAALFYYVQFHLFWRLGLITFITLVPLIIFWGGKLFGNHSRYLKECLKLVPRITLVQAVFAFFTIYQFYLVINRFECFPLLKALISVPLVITANTVPITYSGLGLRESFAMHIFSEYGVSPEIAVTASLMVFVINSVIPGLIGVCLIITGKKS